MTIENWRRRLRFLNAKYLRDEIDETEYLRKRKRIFDLEKKGTVENFNKLFNDKYNKNE